MILSGALLVTAFGSEEGHLDDLGFYCAMALLATVPLAFWFGLLRWRLSEAELVAEQNVRLDAELQARLQELRESRARIMDAITPSAAGWSATYTTVRSSVWSPSGSTCGRYGHRAAGSDTSPHGAVRGDQRVKEAGAVPIQWAP
jgi:hypothetical protein